MAATESSAQARGPVRSSERALAPDLARGFMLLLIALANTAWYLWAAEPGLTSVHPVDGSTLDRFVQAFMITAVDFRVYPMFAFLFGYGIIQLWNRQRAAGVEERSVAALLRRRNLWLLVFGLVHAALLWMGDILGAYGLVGLLLCWLFLRRADRTVLLWAGIATGVLVVLTAFSLVVAFFAAQSPASDTENFLATATVSISTESYLASVVERLVVWPFLVLFQGVFTLVVPIALLLAFWAARHRVLEEPARHLPLLRTTAVGGIAIGWLGGLPHALYHLGLFAVPDSASFVFTLTQALTGLFGGLGYVALFGLLGHWLSERAATSVPVVAITAVGKRSLSSYLAQSVVSAPVLSAWGLGLGGVMGSATMALFALGVWLLTVVLAYLQERAGQRGPAEVLLRRLTYRGTQSPARR